MTFSRALREHLDRSRWAHKAGEEVEDTELTDAPIAITSMPVVPPVKKRRPPSRLLRGIAPPS
jgi:hypothetical protein